MEGAGGVVSHGYKISVVQVDSPLDILCASLGLGR